MGEKIPPSTFTKIIGRNIAMQGSARRFALSDMRTIQFHFPPMEKTILSFGKQLKHKRMEGFGMISTIQVRRMQPLKCGIDATIKMWDEDEAHINQLFLSIEEFQSNDQMFFK